MKLHEFLRAQAVRQPDREAVVCGEDRVTFGQLEEAVHRVAGGLADAGIRAGSRFVVCLPGGVEFVYAFLAACRLGALTVPVNTRLADPEIVHMISDSQAALVITTPARWATLRAHLPENVTAITSFGDLLRTEPRRLPQAPVDADDCVICYTSGTTGRPKGAVVTQANYITAHAFVNAISWGLGPSDRMLVTTPVAHRTGLARIVNMVCQGSTVVIMPKFDVTEASRLIAEEGITVLGMVPTVGRMLIESIEAEPARFASLRIVLGTGEAFPPELADRIEAALPRARVQAFFAMTEVGQIAALDPADRHRHSGSVGRLVPGLELRLLDAAGEPVPPGEPGEIVVRSGHPGQFLVMRGYYNRPEAPLVDGWFATGDVGRLDDDGYLYIVDRKKDMIVSGGYNIYSREVEDTIRELAGVAEVGVVGVPDPHYGESVVSFVQLAPGAELAEEDIVEHCRKRMAGYKKPRRVIFIADFPRGSTGKLLKRELREIAATS
ncbi:class I adenylate-forming enzyme family protein [Streptomyces iranensis]|uniref:class I adenylate-forming enzyme family protein n=1 Tax=Streptomyces iranensis TaxID=576784 RepID=UPI0039B75BA5